MGGGEIVETERLIIRHWKYDGINRHHLEYSLTADEWRGMQKIN
jgi:hypothetical protein